MTTDLETRLRRYATAQDAAIRASLRSTPDSMSTASAIRIDQAVTAPEGRRKFAILGVCTMLVASTIGAIAIRNTSHPEVQGSPDDSTSASPAAGPLPSNVVETALDNSPVPATSDSTPSPTQQPPPLGEGHARVPFTGGNLVLGSDRGWEMFAAGEGSSSRTTSLIDLEGAPTGTPFTNPWIAYRRLGVSPMEDAWLSVASLPRPLRQTDPTASAPTESPPVTAFATIPGPPLQTISIRGTTGTSSEDIWTDLQWEEQGRTVWVSSSLSATELVRELESAVWQDVVGLEQVAGPVADRCYRLENPVVTHDSDLPYFSLPGGTDIEGGKATTVRSADGDAWSRTRTYSSTGADIRTLLITRVDWSKHQCYPSNEGFDGATWANAVAVQVGAAPAEIVEDPATGQFAVRWRVDTGVDALIRSTGLSRDELLAAAGTLSSDPSDGRSFILATPPPGLNLTDWTADDYSNSDGSYPSLNAVGESRAVYSKGPTFGDVTSIRGLGTLAFLPDEVVTVRGHRGLIYADGDSGYRTLRWEERPGIVVQVRVEFHDDPVQVAENLVELSPEAWAALPDGTAATVEDFRFPHPQPCSQPCG